MDLPSLPNELSPGEINSLVELGVCPDCGGRHILRGPAGTTHVLRQHADGSSLFIHVAYTDYTCGDCEMGFHVMTPTEGLRVGLLPSRACFYNPASPEKVCEREACSKTFTGPGLYCCIGCAIEDA